MTSYFQGKVTLKPRSGVAPQEFHPPAGWLPFIPESQVPGTDHPETAPVYTTQK